MSIPCVMFDFELEGIEDNLEEFGCTYECVREMGNRLVQE